MNNAKARTKTIFILSKMNAFNPVAPLVCTPQEPKKPNKGAAKNIAMGTSITSIKNK